MSMKQHIKTQSYGKGDNRYLVVRHLVQNKCDIIKSLEFGDGINDKYVLHKPGTFSV